MSITCRCTQVAISYGAASTSSTNDLENMKCGYDRRKFLFTTLW